MALYDIEVVFMNKPPMTYYKVEFYRFENPWLTLQHKGGTVNKIKIDIIAAVTIIESK